MKSILNTFINANKMDEVAKDFAENCVGREDLPADKAIAPYLFFNDAKAPEYLALTKEQTALFEQTSAYMKKQEEMKTNPHILDARYIAAKAALKLSPQQEKLWDEREVFARKKVDDLLDSATRYDKTMDGKFPLASIVTESMGSHGGVSPGVLCSMVLMVLLGWFTFDGILMLGLSKAIVGALATLALFASFFLTRTISEGRQDTPFGKVSAWITCFFLPAAGSWWASILANLFVHGSIDPKSNISGPLMSMNQWLGNLMSGGSDMPGGIGIGVVLLIAMLCVLQIGGTYLHVFSSSRARTGRESQFNSTSSEAGPMDGMGNIIIGIFWCNVLLLVPTLLVAMQVPVVSSLMYHTLYWAMPGILGLWYGPISYTRHLENAWVLTLGMRDIEAQGANYGALTKNHIFPRRAQLLKAYRDESPECGPDGVALGVFTKKGSGFAPDAGKRLVQTRNDKSRHSHIFGGTGSGKTVSWILPQLFKWVRNKCGGFLVVCGKGVLAKELEGMRNFKLIKPGVPLGLYEGMDPVSITRAYEGVNHLDAMKAGSGSAGGQFYLQAAQRQLDASTRLMFYLCEAELREIEGKVNKGLAYQTLMENRQWTKTPITHSIIIRKMADFYDEKSDCMKLLNYVKGFHPLVNVMVETDASGQEQVFYEFDNSGAGMLLEMTLNNIQAITTMDAETRSNMFETLKNWFSPLFSHEDLVAWMGSETGVKIENVLKGEGYGVYLPVDKYGQGAALVQALIKNRVMAGINARDDHWRDTEGATEVLLTVDEAHAPGLITPQDIILASQARSKGACLDYGTQSLPSYIAAIGREGTMSFLQNFTTQGCLQVSSSPETLDYMIALMGEGHVRESIFHSSRIQVGDTIEYAARLAAFNEAHPEYAGLMNLRRNGHFQFEGSEMEERSIYGADTSHKSKIRLIRTQDSKFTTWTNKAEASAKLEGEKGTCLIKLLRADGMRHDFYKLNPAIGIPEDLRDHNFKKAA